MRIGYKTAQNACNIFLSQRLAKKVLVLATLIATSWP